MWLNRICVAGLSLLPLIALAQQESALTMKQIMLERVHPAANEILLAAFRGAPDGEKGWGKVSESASALKEAANLLKTKNSQPEWISAAAVLSAAAEEAYKAAQAKNQRLLPAIATRIDASCTECHKRYRPNVFPPEGKGGAE